ncbi:hypothetical protein AJ87_14810 [Rhizobium yanglingense]|nr:hypothetical protein AJ87_14810 [Rhizobium yanglingense]
MQALEERLNRELFVRDKAGMRLTIHGEQLLEHCRSINMIVSEVQSRFGPGGVGQEVRISAVPSIGQEILIPHIETLRRKYPDVHFTLNTASDNCDLDTGGIDIAVRVSRPDHGQYVVRKVSSLKLSCYARKPHDRPMLPAPDQPLVVFGARKYDERMRNSLILGLYPNNPIAITVFDFQSMINAMRAGLGQGLIPDFVARGYSELCSVPEQKEVTPVDVWVILRDSPCRRRLLKEIASEISRVIATRLKDLPNNLDAEPRIKRMSLPSLNGEPVADISQQRQGKD